MKDKTIGIIGQGFVGKIIKKFYPQAKTFDIKGEYDPLREVLSQDIIFVAVNIPDNCRSTESKKILDDYFAATKPGSLVIIKSTFVPGILDYFQSLHQHIKFVYNPEFLTELSAWDDFTKPRFQILGCPQQSLALANELFEFLPEAPVRRIVSPIDAELLKHSFNSYYITKVVFFNQLFDISKELGSDYETIREILVQDPRIGDSHSIIFHKGYRGAGGKCLPKDSGNLSAVTSSPLLKSVVEINNKYLQNGAKN